MDPNEIQDLYEFLLTNNYTIDYKFTNLINETKNNHINKKKIINYKVNFGMLLWKTDIYFAFNSSSINKKLNLKK